MSESVTPQPESDPKTRRSATLLAALGLVLITGGAVGGLVYDTIIHDNPNSITQIGTLATLGVGGLLALAGARSKDGE